MKRHLTDGELRASLDGEADAAGLHHLGSCAGCQERLRQVEAQAQLAGRRLAFLAPAALDQVPGAATSWRHFSDQAIKRKEISMFKKWFAFPVVRIGTALVLILALVLAFPGTRALAGELLNLFRVQQVTVIPVDFTGLEQLSGGASGQQLSELISKSVDMTQRPGAPMEVADAKQAGQAAGFTVRLPQNPSPSQIYVTGAAAYTVTVDQKKAQALLDEAGRSDLVLPESIDGARISVKIPTTVTTAYGACPKPQEDFERADPDMPGRRYPDCVMLVQLPSPTIDAPADVDVAQLAQIGLEFTGMTPDQAAAFTNSVDWASTLVIPIPKNAATYEQVAVDGVTGTLIQRPADDAPQYALVWVKDGIVYAISSMGTNSQQAIDMANSLP